MYIITVLPIARGISKESLSYFSKEDFPQGSVVSIPVRKKTISGIVLSSTKASEMKTELKNLPFSVKKLEIQSKDTFFSESFMKAVEDASIYFSATAGSVIANIFPKIFLEKEIKKESENKNRRFEEYAIQNDTLERIDMYKGIIREAFAKKESVFICLPTEEAAKKLLEKLSRGIEKYAILFTSGLSEKKSKETTKIIHTNPHPLLVVGTLSFTPFFREDIKTIIIEEESSRFYKSRSRPYLDTRDFLKFFAKHFKAKIIYADTLLRVETLFRIQMGEIVEYSRIMGKRHKNISTLIVNMKKEEAEEKKFQVLSDELKEMITYADKHKKNLFIFTARRGLSSQTVCRDCGETVLCSRCSAPVVLHKQKETNNFICHHCGTQRSAEETCKKCGSWRLESFGVGIEKVLEEILKITKKDILRLDADFCKTSNEAKKIISKFQEKGKILLGTEMALQYLEEGSADYSAIASFDSLFSLPDFRIEERIMHIILSVKAIALENFLIQGRNVENKVVEYGASGDLSNFAKNELLARERFGYPPFKTLIKITISGNKEEAWQEAENINELLEKYSPIIFPAFIKTIKGKSLLHMLIKIDPKKWPDRNLRDLLLSLPQSVLVKIDPESLL